MQSVSVEFVPTQDLQCPWEGLSERMNINTGKHEKLLASVEGRVLFCGDMNVELSRATGPLVHLFRPFILLQPICL